MSTVTQEKDYGHVPVLLHECLDALAIKPDGIYVDGTLGRAGHSLEIVKRLTTGRLIGIDRDETAIAAARERLADYGDRVTLVHSNFDRIGDILADLHIDGADGMLFDLGVSSPQLDDAERGFSYMHDAPLDMRMDRTAYLTAREVVNSWSYEELRRILFEYGEERYAPAIAKRIVQHREQQPIETTLELVDIIKSAMPPLYRLYLRLRRPYLLLGELSGLVQLLFPRQRVQVICQAAVGGAVMIVGHVKLPPSSVGSFPPILCCSRLPYTKYGCTSAPRLGEK